MRASSAVCSSCRARSASCSTTVQALTSWLRLRGFFELLVAVQRQDRALHRRPRGVVAATARRCRRRGRSVAKLSSFSSRALRAASAAATRTFSSARARSLLAQADDGHALRLEAAVAVVGVDDGDGGRLAGDLAVGDQLRDLAAQRGVDGAGGAAGLR